LAVGEALHADIAYDPEATTVDTTPAEAFAMRRGVCQDMSQVMIACLRGAASRRATFRASCARSRPPAGRASPAPTPCTPGCAPWCGREAGWIEYDPTNACVVGADHVEIARGRDYGDVAPVVGVLRTAGSQKTRQAVDVLPAPGPA
jgi:transglutaminase-like putative cysteine protease